MEQFVQSIDCVCREPFVIKIPKAEGYKGEFIEELVFDQVTVNTMLKLQPLLVKLTGIDELLDDTQVEAVLSSDSLKFLGKQLEIIGDNQETILKIICTAYWNKQGKYPEWYEQYFACNLGDFSDMYILLRAIVARLNTQAFISSTILLSKGMGLITKQEIIACSTQFK